jgi:hypothetical protein
MDWVGVEPKTSASLGKAVLYVHLKGGVIEREFYFSNPARSILHAP